MPKEIERKFLVKENHPEFQKIIEEPPFEIYQGYLKSDKTGVVRVRTFNSQGFLTVKGPTVGITRNEFEYEIPFKDANQMLEEMCDNVIHKHRYIVPFGNGLYVEIDVFKQINLVLVEVELPDENTQFTKPDWFGEEVSHLPEYYNNSIAERIHIPT